ncbi:hypothetical protein OTU49_003734 [Cherax quadricarinatus]|uniref:Uncharacterized protein n=1 Tax=Cherax quadricarinatus TaxID=27406 RepID=A0AAW0XHC2_CHEQU
MKRHNDRLLICTFTEAGASIFERLKTSMKLCSREPNSEHKLAVTEVGNSGLVSTLARQRVASNEQGLKWKEDAKSSLASRVDDANSDHNSAMTGDRKPGRIREGFRREESWPTGERPETGGT